MPMKTKLVESIHNLGSSQFGATILATDPCYSRGTWCQEVVDGVLPGTWNAYSLKQSLKLWGTRTAVLVSHHAEHPVKAWSTCWEHLSSGIGVDSGQAGLFDAQRFPAKDVGDFEEKESFYGRCCSITLAEPSAGAVPEGFVTESGVGDGEYDLLVQRDLAGHIVAMAIIFLPFRGMWRAMATFKSAA